VTEIPEHLLARSRQARAAAAGGDASSDTAADATPAPAAAAPATAAAAEVAPAEPPPPEPVAPYVEAAKNRKTIPVWIIPVLLFIPIWAIYYVGLLESPPAEEGGLLSEGAEVYQTSGCAGCHGGGGAGGTGRQLNNGEVLLTFPSAEAGASFDGLASQISWVVNGTGGTQNLGLTSYGDPAREGGAREAGSFGGMGGNNSLSVEALLAVVHYERVTHGGLDDEAAALELEVLEHAVEKAEAEGIEWSGQSPDEVAELLSEARAELGIGGGEAASG
jgi:hypothetical protein